MSTLLNDKRQCFDRFKAFEFDFINFSNGLLTVLAKIQPSPLFLLFRLNGSLGQLRFCNLMPRQVRFQESIKLQHYLI